MAIRNDVTVDWHLSPRLLTVASPSTEITIQDIVDTCRFFEDSSPGENFEYLIDAAGKEPLGGSTFVGVTATLNNAYIAFEARPGPDWILCQILGGNLVSQNASGGELDPRFPTAFTTIDRTASSSATLSEQDALNYASYQNAVWVDITTSTTGIVFPAGTRETPVNNIQDAVTIGELKGFSTIQLLSNITLTSGDNVSNFELSGVSHVNTYVIIQAAANCTDVRISNCNVTGVLDGGTEIGNCVVGDLTYFNGHIHDCGLTGTIYLNGGVDAVLNNCSTIDQDDPSTIDMGVSGQSLAMSNYSGLVTLTNLASDTEEIGIGLDAGAIVLDSTISAGTIIISGIGLLTDNSTGTASVNSDGLINKDNIAVAVWDEPVGDHIIADTMGHEMYHMAYQEQVHIDVVNGSAGTTFPTGTHHDPCNNLADALTIAGTHYFDILTIIGSLTVSGGEDLSGFTVRADRSLGNTVTVVDAITDTTYFEDLTVSGHMKGPVRYTTCVMGTITGFDGGAKNSLLTGSITITGGNANYFTDCDTYVVDASFKEISVGANYLNIIRCRGNYEITNYTGASVVAIDLSTGMVNLASSCVSGIISVAGIVRLIDNSGAGCIVIDGTLTEDGTAESTWTTSTTGAVSGSYGEMVNDIKIDTSLIPATV